MALTHHERYDGRAYPRQLAGESIPIDDRIAAVADVFDALTSNRVKERYADRSVAVPAGTCEWLPASRRTEKISLR